MPLIERSHTVASAEVGLRMDRIVQSLCGLSRAQVIGLFDRGCVQLNGAICRHPGQTAEAEDQLQLRYDPQQRYHPEKKPRRNLGFEIVHEDPHLIVVIKPADLLTVPTRRGETTTLVDKLNQYLRHVRGVRQVYRVHRLDRGVSGLLVFGKSLQIAEAIRDQFELHKPEREYMAVVAGLVDELEGRFESLLATGPDLTRFSTDDETIGQRAVTHFHVLKRLGDATLVRVWLETGRRNQIRVHFAEAGHPVLGDPRYRPQLAAHPRWPYKRLALHARQLGFDHPVSGQHLRFATPLPAEMDRFLRHEQRQRS